MPRMPYNENQVDASFMFKSQSWYQKSEVLIYFYLIMILGSWP